MSDVNLEFLSTITVLLYKIPLGIPLTVKCHFGKLSRLNVLVSTQCSAAAQLSHGFSTTFNELQDSVAVTPIICFQHFSAAH